jgi:hypothetical protein
LSAISPITLLAILKLAVIIAPGADRPAEVEALVEQGSGLPPGAFVGPFFSDE